MSSEIYFLFNQPASIADRLKAKELITKLVDNQLALPESKRGFDLVSAVKELRQKDIGITLNELFSILQEVLKEKGVYLNINTMQIHISDLPF